MPFCIAGMHRSGTSMLTRLLHLCGVYLGEPHELSGPLPDNLEGHWENGLFRALNDRILSLFGGGWDLPPFVPQGWELGEALDIVRDEALALIQRFNLHEPWGWKDPRNSLTLPFWQSLLPDMRVIICLRDPLAVAQSLHKRGSSSLAFGLQLWLTYYERLISAVLPEDRVVTHYDAYFVDPQAELRRVLEALGIPASDETIHLACSTVQDSLRHHWPRVETFDLADLSRSVRSLYAQLCAEAGPVCEVAVRVQLPTGDLSDGLMRERESGEYGVTHQQRLEALLVNKEQTIQTLSMHLAEKEQTIQTLSLHLAEKEQTIQCLSTQLASKEQAMDALMMQHHDLAAKLALIQSSKAWRLVRAYWTMAGCLRRPRLSKTLQSVDSASARSRGVPQLDISSVADQPVLVGFGPRGDSGISTETEPLSLEIPSCVVPKREGLLQRIRTAFKFYLANHLINRVPSFRLRHWYYRRILHYKIGRGSAIHMNVFVTGDFISIGDHTVINRGCYLDGRIGITIANNVSVSPEVYIISMEHDPNSPSFATRGAPVVIESAAWVGARAILTPGVTVGEGSVIGAGAVVTKNISPYRIAVGVPAREVKDRNRNLDYRLSYFTWFDTDVQK